MAQVNSMVIAKLGLASDRLRGETVLVTGAGGGMGYETTRLRIAQELPEFVQLMAAESASGAGDRMEYAETAAKYEYLNLTVGEIGEGISSDEIRVICSKFDFKQNYSNIKTGCPTLVQVEDVLCPLKPKLFMILSLQHFGSCYR
jgi:hypothetical protein